MGRVELDSRAEELYGFATRLGGLGFRTWQRTADPAFLASYVSACYQLPSLFPDLAHHFPDVRVLVPCQPGSSISLLDNSPVVACPSRRGPPPQLPSFSKMLCPQQCHSRAWCPPPPRRVPMLRRSPRTDDREMVLVLIAPTACRCMWYATRTPVLRWPSAPAAHIGWQNM